MNNKNDERNIKVLLDNFAAALNTADAESIPMFFTGSGKFMPDSIRTINNPSSLAKNTNKQLSANAFQIQFTLQELEVDGQLALVTATANTSQLEVDSLLATTKITRDFFVFKKIGTDWKIHRYIYNNVE